MANIPIHVRNSCHPHISPHIHRGRSTPLCACGAAEEIGHHLVFECPRHEGIRREFLVGKSSWKELDKADWRKVGDGDNEWYLEAVDEFFGHLYGAMSGRSASHT